MRLPEMWQVVYREAMQFTEALVRLPDECRCGDGDAHLEGRCLCCEASHVSGTPGAGVSCAETLSRLHADYSMLCKDVMRVSAPIEEAAPGGDLLEVRRGVRLAAKDLERIGQELDRVDDAILGFRKRCTISELRRAKRHAAELRVHCERVNDTLMGQDAGSLSC